MKISVILLFLLYIGILIFAKIVFDHHHAYNRRSEITHMNLVTCNGTAKVWCSISSIFTCRILETLRSIVLAITRKKLSNKFLIYEAEWNYVKMNRDGKCKSVMLSYIIFLTQLLIPRIYASIILFSLAIFTISLNSLYFSLLYLWHCERLT